MGYTRAVLWNRLKNIDTKNGKNSKVHYWLLPDNDNPSRIHVLLTKPNYYYRGNINNRGWSVTKKRIVAHAALSTATEVAYFPPLPHNNMVSLILNYYRLLTGL